MALQNFCHGDTSIGPLVSGCGDRDDSDFTLRFELLLSLLFSCIAISYLLVRLRCLSRRPSLALPRRPRVYKLTIYAFLLGVQASLIGLVGSLENPLQSLWLAADALALPLVLVEASISCLEQSRSLRPSVGLQLVLLLNSCVDIIWLRSTWSYRGNSLQHAYWGLRLASLVLKILALLLETFLKGAIRPTYSDKHSPEDFSGLFGLATHAWLNPLLLVGYRKSLSASDLYPLPSPLTADRLLPRDSTTENRWSTILMRSSLPSQVIVTMIPRALMSVFSFAQVFLLQAVLSHLQQNSEEQTSNSTTHVLVVATFLIYAGLALSTAWYWRANEKMLLMGRSLLMGILYSQTMSSSIADTTDSEVVTLVGTELERIRQGFERVHDLWCCPIEAAVAVWLLFGRLGPSAMAPITVVVLVALCTTAIGPVIPKSQRAWLSARQERVSFTADVVKNLETLQIANLMACAKTLLHNMRRRDISWGQKFRLQQMSVLILAYVPTHLSPVFAFAFTNANSTATTLFPSIALIQLLTSPLETVIQSVPAMLTSFACFGRIRLYLSEHRRKDSRSIHVAAADRSGSGIAIEMTQCSFGWSPEHVVLHDINARIPVHSLTVVSGPTGSGKSTLCKALMGEVPMATGCLKLLGSTSDSIGFCGQEPFLLNSTIQRNITGHLPFDHRLYQKVLEVVMLVDDLQQMEYGNQTEVGSHGSNLSGGQKQRIAFARALYARPSVYVLDDVLTGLDATMAQRIFNNAIGPTGWIKSHGGTVIFASNDSDVGSANYKIILGYDGRCRTENGCQPDVQKKPAEVPVTTTTSISKAPVSFADVGHQSIDSSTYCSIDDSEECNTENAPSEVFSNADGLLSKAIGQSKNTYRHYKYYLKASGRMAFSLFTCLAFFYAGLLNMVTVWVSFWSSDRFHQPKSVYLGIYGLAQALTLLFQYASMLVFFLCNTRTAGYIIHDDALEALTTATLQLRAGMDHGRMTALFSQDVNIIDGEVPSAMINTVFSSCIAIGLLAVVGMSSPYILISVPVIVFVLIAIQRLYLRTARRLRILELETKEPIYAHILEALQGRIYIRAFHWEPQFIRTNNILIDRYTQAAYLLAMLRHWLEFVLGMMITGLATIVVALAFYLRSDASFSGASLISLTSMAQVLNTVVRFGTRMEMSMGGVERLRDFADNARAPACARIALDPTWPARGTIVLKGVDASYPGRGGTAGQTPHALCNVNFRVDPACKVAIVGRSGSGKSSIMRLLLRVLNHESGSIRIGDVELNEIDTELVRRRIIAVPQETVLLPGASVKRNIDPYGCSTHTECLEVLHLVGLGRLVNEDSSGLDVILYRESLSQGETQILGLARSILRRRQQQWQTSASTFTMDKTQPQETQAVEKEQDGGILLLDELCSAVDRKTYEDMWRIVWDEFRNYTILTVVHRWEGLELEKFDRVLALDRGRVVSFGSPHAWKEPSRSMCLEERKGF